MIQTTDTKQLVTSEDVRISLTYHLKVLNSAAKTDSSTIIAHVGAVKALTNLLIQLDEMHR